MGWGGVEWGHWGLSYDDLTLLTSTFLQTILLLSLSLGLDECEYATNLFLFTNEKGDLL